MAADYARPPVRRLRVYAFDPQASTQIETAGINVATIELPWEADFEELLPGPINDYLEVIDVDPVSGQLYDPIDLNHFAVLAQNGLPPSEGDPRFHQQMVFAVAMKTIRAFERALGRRVFWAPKKQADGSYERVRRLRVYPHALREPNAYYSKDKVALLFGYFRASSREAGANWVFTALSHDVVTHETTHAILDGLHRRYAEPTSIDSLAFHEAFADVVALLSHFTLTEAVQAEIAAKGGRLDQRSLITGLAQQFGRATGRAGALREAVDTKMDGMPDASLIETVTEPHERGAILVAAIFDAFLTIYQARSADLMRLAEIEVNPRVSRSLHPDLVRRLAREASKSAEHVLRMCLRALDYLPPVDVRFGEYLRAIVTADTDLIPLDRYNYRIAVVEAFRRRGIMPDGCLSLAPDSLLWENSDAHPPLSLDTMPPLKLDPVQTRGEAVEAAESNRRIVQDWMMKSDGNDEDELWQDACGVVFRQGFGKGGDLHSILDWPTEREGGKPRFHPNVEVHSVRVTRRAGPDGQDLRQLVVEVTQRRRGFLLKADQDTAETFLEQPAVPNFTFRGGATLIFDLTDRKLRYTIRKRITDDARLEAQRAYITERSFSGLAATYSGASRLDEEKREPFAMAHRGGI
jgi:hypothetical protein